MSYLLIAELEAKIDRRDDRIVELEAKIYHRDERIEELEEFITQFQIAWDNYDRLVEKGILNKTILGMLSTTYKETTSEKL